MELDSLDFVDDVTHLSYTYQLIQVEIDSIAAASTEVDFNIYNGKSKIIKYNTENTILITLDGKVMEEVKDFPHLCRIIDK